MEGRRPSGVLPSTRVSSFGMVFISSSEEVAGFSPRGFAEVRRIGPTRGKRRLKSGVLGMRMPMVEKWLK